MLYRIYKALVGLFWRPDDFAPHSESGFEGYYSRVQLDDGATLAIIFCWVKDAKERTNLVHVSYTPRHGKAQTTRPVGGAVEAFKTEFFPGRRSVHVHPALSDHRVPFSVSMQGVGSMRVGAEMVEYKVSVPDANLQVDLTLTNRVPWWQRDVLSGPMGFLSRLSPLLPLNWHVYSTASSAACTISHNGRKRHATGVAHTEKNWGTSFPPGWIWSQSFGNAKAARSLSLAGGEALPGVEAYLIGYRSSKLAWDFTPPFAVAVGPISPFMTVRRDSAAGTIDLVVSTFTKKLAMNMSAPPDSFMGIAAPLKDGHRPMFAFESFQARTRVQAWERRWPWQKWTLVEEGECGVSDDGSPCSALEFGGSYSHHVRDGSARSR
ncbi:hypothetical protein BDW22DRAFT_860799 [Trametopsis cervina]|nr:hypothetical protein BDW22DRAFT_860799 [Trametopsis cervina]